MGARFSAPVHTGPGAHPAFCTMDTGSFLGVKRPGRGVDHPPPSKCRGQERVELYLYSPSGLSWPVIGSTLFVYTHKCVLCATAATCCGIRIQTGIEDVLSGRQIDRHLFNLFWRNLQNGDFGIGFFFPVQLKLNLPFYLNNLYRISEWLISTIFVCLLLSFRVHFNGVNKM